MKTFRLPGLVDLHVHLRDPGQTHKEDFYTGTSAALAGGYTAVVDMPNNAEPITTLYRLEAKIDSAKSKIVCDVGFHFGTLGNNFDQFPLVVDKVQGLKIYMNVTTGNFIIDKDRLIDIYKAWPSDKPILLHAEDDVSDIVMNTLKAVPKPTHICHVSSAAELEFVMRAKDKGWPITCGVTPHHLFLIDKHRDELGEFAVVKPSLKPQTDQDFLWQHLDAIDVIETDHAPHTRDEKKAGAFGVPGLETMLPLMLQAEREGRITRKQIIDKSAIKPAEIMGITRSEDTYIEIEPTEWVVNEESLHTQCGWSPFTGRTVFGKVAGVFLRGQKVFEDGKVLAAPGSGKVL